MINVYPLLDMIDELSKDEVDEILAKFTCPLDTDIENFVHNKAYEFERHDLARTFLVYSDDKFVGIFSIAMNEFISKEKLASSVRKRLFGTTYAFGKKVPVHLIGQLSKNYSDDNQELIEGTELLKIAEKYVSKANVLSAAPLIRIDCKDEDVLKRFYEENGFRLADELIEDNESLLMYLFPTKNINQQSSWLIFNI